MCISALFSYSIGSVVPLIINQTQVKYLKSEVFGIRSKFLESILEAVLCRFYSAVGTEKVCRAPSKQCKGVKPQMLSCDVVSYYVKPGHRLIPFPSVFVQGCAFIRPQ